MLSGNTIKGMVWDVHSNIKDEQTYSFVFNGNLHNHSSEQSYPFISNNLSNIECIKYKEGYKVIGLTSIKELGSSILFLYNESTGFKTIIKINYDKNDLGGGDNYVKLPNNCIKIIENEQAYACSYMELLHTNCFNWSNEHPLQIEYQITDTTLNLYFVNGYDQDRFISFNLDDYSLNKDFKIKENPDNCDTRYEEGLDCDKTLWYPKVNNVEITLEKVDGGRKLSGHYNYLVAYSTSKGIPISTFTGLGKGIDLFEIGKKGTEYGVKININNISTDSRYRFYTIVVVESINGVTSYKQIGTFPISQKVVFDWDNEGQGISLPILMSQYPFYKNSKSITESNNILFKAGLSEFEKFNLQSVISEVEVEWVTTILKEGDYRDNRNFMSYLRDEVYALGIEIVLDNLEKGPVFLLVNRESNSNDLTLVNGKPRWKVENTASKTWTSNLSKDVLYENNIKGFDSVFEFGSFGYHESTERYPNVPEVWGPLCGQPIRLFRFPDHKVTSHISDIDNDGKNFIVPLGVRIKTDMNTVFDKAVSQGLITKEQRERITGWKLVRGNRSGNHSIIAKGLLYNMIQYKRENKDENFSLFRDTAGICTREDDVAYFPNYPFNDLKDDPYLTNESRWYLEKTSRNIQNYQPDLLPVGNTKRYTFHSPDTHFTNPNLGNFLKVEGIMYGESEGFFNQSEDQAKQRLLNWKHYDLSISLARYIARLQKSPAQEDVQQLASNVGSQVGGVIQTVASAFGPIGAAVGGVVKGISGFVGGLIGKNIYNNNGWFQFIDATFKSAITYTETEKLINIISSLIKPRQYHYQYQAVGNYNKLKTDIDLDENTKEIDVKEYISNGKYTIEGDNINNYNRESSVYLKLKDELSNDPLLDEEIKDTSKFLISDDSDFGEIILKSEEEVSCSKFKIYQQEDFSSPAPGQYHIFGEYCTEPTYIERSQVHSSMLATYDKVINGEYEEGTYIDFDENWGLPSYTMPEWELGMHLFFPRLGFKGKYRGLVVIDENGQYKLQLHSECLGIITLGVPGFSEVINLYNNETPMEERCFAQIHIVPADKVYITIPYCIKQYPLPPAPPIPNCILSPTRYWYTDQFVNEFQGFDYRYDTNIVVDEEELDCGTITRTIYKKETTNCSCNTIRIKKVASYYGSLKREIPNQYGTVYDIQWINTGSGLNNHRQNIFGGDTFIGRMALKRKHSFFNQTLFNNPEDSEINYSLLGNAANPVYFYDKNPLKIERPEFNLTSLRFPIINLNKNNRNAVLRFLESKLLKIEEQVNIPKYKLDCGIDPSTETYRRKMELYPAEGFMYLYSYGIVSFIGESNINVDLRNIGEGLEEDFYPHITDLERWLQEKNVSPSIDNFYLYDRSYSKQDIEEFKYLYDINFRGDNKNIDRSNRVIYSSQAMEIEDSDYSDPFLINKALDFYDFSKKNGKLISITGIEGDKVFVRQEHNSSVFGAYLTLNTDHNTILVSSGSIFSNKPVEFASPDLGYFGGQHQAILNTPFGHITVDSVRGQVFLLGNGGQGLEEISNKGMFSFFKEHLPFQINKHYPSINIDNNFNGIGISMVYDNRFQVFHLTKLDYIVKDLTLIYKEGKFYKGLTEVKLGDSRYFDNISWTISFSLLNQSWYSFQPFTPNFYIEHLDYFDSGIENGIWRHNITNKSYQRFYGRLYPFIVETNTKFDSLYHHIKNVNYSVDVIQYMNKYDKIHRIDKSFNKAIVSTSRGTSGLLNLKNVENNLYLENKYPILARSSSDILLTKKEGFHKFNQFRNIVRHPDIPIWKRVNNGYFEELNPDALNGLGPTDTLVGDQVKVRLIQDKEDKYQFIFKGTYINDIIRSGRIR